jgi:hypothetical protein
MNTTNIDFPSRISVRAITAGILTTFAATILLMTLAAGLGLWSYRIEEVPNLGAGFWVFFFVAWTVSLGVGAFVSSVAGRSSTRVDGLLYGGVTWAGACVLGCLTMAVGTGRFFNFTAGQTMPGMFWLIFFGDAIALIVALWFGAKGVHVQVKAARQAEQPSPRRVA